MSQFTTTPFTAVYHFKQAKPDTDSYNNLKALISAGVLTDADIKEGEEGAIKRKSVNAVLETVNMIELLDGTGLSNAQIKTVQDLVNKHVEDANKSLVDEGKTDYITGAEALEKGLAQRGGAIKVSKEMVDAAVLALGTFLKDIGATEKGYNLITKLAAAKFTPASIIKIRIQTPVVESIADRISSFAESLGAMEAEKHLPVIELWAENLEKTLNPQQDDISTDDLFA